MLALILLPRLTYGDKANLAFHYHLYYFSQAPYSTAEKIQDLTQRVEKRLSSRFESVQGPLKGTARIFWHHFAQIPEDLSQTLKNDFPSIVVVEGHMAPEVLATIEKSGKVPQVLMLLNVPEVEGLNLDRRIPKTLNVFGEEDLKSGLLEITDPSRIYNVSVAKLLSVNPFLSERNTLFFSDLLYTAFFESLSGQQPASRPAVEQDVEK